MDKFSGRSRALHSVVLLLGLSDIREINTDCRSVNLADSPFQTVIDNRFTIFLTLRLVEVSRLDEYFVTFKQPVVFSYINVVWVLSRDFDAKAHTAKIERLSVREEPQIRPL